MNGWQLTIEDHLEKLSKEARGATCEAGDCERLTKQGAAVYRVLRDLRPHGLKEISAAVGAGEASVSARIREIRAYLEGRPRKDDPPELARVKLGTVLREKVAGIPGLFTYEIRLNRSSGAA